MRKLLAVSALIVVTGCHQRVAVPTAEELVRNRPLLAEWQGKCNTGEYSHLAAAEKTDLCATTQQATISVAQQAASKNDADFFEANTIRKEKK